jgi:hypothetical protein
MIGTTKNDLRTSANECQCILGRLLSRLSQLACQIYFCISLRFEG